MKRRYLATLLMIAGLNGVFFFQGCDDKKLQVTLGCVLPCAELTVTEVKLSSRPNPPEILWPTRAVFWSPLRLALNVAAAAGIALWLQRLWRRRVFVGDIHVAFWIAFVLFNSFVVLMHGWFWAVFWPTARLAQGAIWVLTLGRTTEDSSLAPLVIPWASRVYFVAVVLVLGALVALVRTVRSRRQAPPKTP